MGRSSFAASTLYRAGHGEAFTPEAHDVADALLAEVLPRLQLDSAPGDLPYLRRVLGSAAQVGAGIALVSRSRAGHDDFVDRQVAGALLEAADELPAMPAHRHAVATYFLYCGYYLARTGPAGLTVLLAELDEQG